MFENCNRCGVRISIHSLRMEGDQIRHRVPFFDNSFQSTPSAWRETNSSSCSILRQFISIHSLRMEGDLSAAVVRYLFCDFNPLPPHGGRPISYKQYCFEFVFQSTPSAWRETAVCITGNDHDLFQSTPSAWRETSILPGDSQAMNHFNPLPPHGGRRAVSF